jgi:ubiquitin-conjugating enzyme E2 D/E
MLDLAKEDLGEITLSPNEANIFAWKATLPGPKGSPYEGGVFEVDIRIPEDYPYVT